MFFKPLFKSLFWFYPYTFFTPELLIGFYFRLDDLQTNFLTAYYYIVAINMLFMFLTIILIFIFVYLGNFAKSTFFFFFFPMANLQRFNIFTWGSCYKIKPDKKKILRLFLSLYPCSVTTEQIQFISSSRSCALSNVSKHN